MIRSFFRKLWHLITTPFRWIARPFLKLRDFLNFEPEDSSLADVFSRTIEEPSILIDHLEALRRHLLRAIAVLIIAVLASTLFAKQALDWLAGPIGGLDQLQAIEVTESIGAFMRVSLMSGFAMALPYIGIEIFAFLNPGLRRRERILLLAAIPAASILFVLGIAFTYFILLTPALDFLLHFMDINAAIRPASYIQFVTGLMFWIGVAFQFPLIIYALAGLGFVNAKALMRSWRFAVLGIAVLAAAITPTIDPVNMGLVMLPMVVLYFISIGLAAIAGRGRTRRAQSDTN
ncbi:MAG TPA: twin-arginine translocase subunit TatC [Anaerolineales bacterium]|nr:twin-arginine translocase subunit TatC [Anaerolineales bacterium]